MSAALNLTQGALSLSNPTISTTLTVGASGSKSQSEAWSNTAVGTTIKADSLVLNAGRDVHLQGVQAKITTDITIDAGRNVTIESAQSTAGSSSSSSSWNIGAGLGGSCSAASGCSGGIYLEGGAAQAKANSWSVTQLNTHLTAGGNVHIGSGQDTTLAGAVVKAATIDVDVKGNLTLASRQDTAHGSASSSNIGGSLTIGLVGPSSVSVSGGGSRSTSDLAWVREQTGLYATDKLAVRVEKHTQINGAVVNSDTGQLTLDTGTLGFSDIQDHDTATSVSGQVGIGVGLQPNGTGQPGQPSGTVSGSYASHTIEQVTKATIGEGTIVIRNEDKQKQDVKDINRDVTQAQVITKDEREGVQVYVSDASIKVAVDVLEKAGSTLKDAFAASVEERKDIDPQTKKAAGKLVEDVLSGKIRPEDLRGCVQHSFNLHDIIFTPAYAGGACEQYNKEAINLCLSFLDKTRAGLIEQGADFVNLFKDRLKEDPQGFDDVMRLFNVIAPEGYAVDALVDEVKKEIAKNPDDANAIIATVGSYLSEQSQKLQNGEIPPEVGLAATVGALYLAHKLAPKSLRNKVLEKTGDLVTTVLNTVRSGGKEIKLINGVYQVDGLPFKFNETYYEKLWSTGRGAPFVQAQEVLSTFTARTKDEFKDGYFRYTNGYMEMVYNPTTKDVWHLQPLRK